MWVQHQTETFHHLNDICEIKWTDAKAEEGKYDWEPSVKKEIGHFSSFNMSRVGLWVPLSPFGLVSLL